jgi:N-acyl-D-amino-acid deacylase
MIRLWVVLLLAASSWAQDYDVIIRNARIVDGTGNPWFRGDVGIRGGRIAAVGRLEQAGAARTVDAAGRYLAPGFIDVHTHLERAVLTAPEMAAFLFDGVTTVVTGNCGFSATDLAAFFASVEKARPGVNVASLIGHNAIRDEVMGGANRAPTPQEQARMRDLVRRGMEAGAVGFSTGLWYTPGAYSATPEVIDLARVAAPFGGVYATHMRDEGVRVEEAIREAFEIGRESGLRVEISHFKVMDKRHWGSTAATLALVDEARGTGLDVVVDQYPYTAASTFLDIFFPRTALAGGLGPTRERLSSPESRARIAREIAASPELRMGHDNYAFAVIAEFPEDRSVEGLPIAEINRRRGRPSTLANEIETVIDLMIQGRPLLVYHVMSDGDVERILRHPNTTVASDAIYVPPGETTPHPRNYGTNARVFAEYVRKRQALSLESAVRKMTSLPARTFGLHDRGLIRAGLAADLVLIDFATVQDLATFDKPHQFSRGFDLVLVNGDVAVEAGKPAARAGRILRRP